MERPRSCNHSKWQSQDSKLFNFKTLSFYNSSEINYLPVKVIDYPPRFVITWYNQWIIMIFFVSRALCYIITVHIHPSNQYSYHWFTYDLYPGWVLFPVESMTLSEKKRTVYPWCRDCLWFPFSSPCDSPKEHSKYQLINKWKTNCWLKRQLLWVWN